MEICIWIRSAQIKSSYLSKNLKTLSIYLHSSARFTNAWTFPTCNQWSVKSFNMQSSTRERYNEFRLWGRKTSLSSSRKLNLAVISRLLPKMPTLCSARKWSTINNGIPDTRWKNWQLDLRLLKSLLLIQKILKNRNQREFTTPECFKIRKNFDILN